MRFKLFLICLGVVVLSLASGLGLRFALAAWQEPTASPPGGNVRAPINEGATSQAKEGGLSIGGLFLVNGLSNGIVIGNPMPTGGDMGEGSLNAKKICINGNCLTNWTLADAFIQNGNSFGALAVLGTNDNFPLAFETNNIERMRIDIAGNVTIGGKNICLADGTGCPTTLGNYVWLQGTTPGTQQTGHFNVSGTALIGGNVGIGTTGPTTRLHVKAVSHLAGAFRLDQYGATGARDFLYALSGGGANYDTLYLRGEDSTGSEIFSDIMSWHAGGNVGIGYDAGLGTGKLIVNGNVGIGTITPGSKLSVLGGVAVGSTYASFAAPSDGAIIQGNVGIGTATPAQLLALEKLSGNNAELSIKSVAGVNTHWGIYQDRDTSELRFWRGENNVIMTAAGDLNSRRCFGPVYVGQTGATYNGARGGYTSANALCAASVAGSHVCTTAEILETIKCNQPSLPTTDQAWVTNGPPGYTARANDCTGWTSTSPSGATTVYGAIWAFDASGGVGWVTTCNQSLKFACCK